MKIVHEATWLVPISAEKASTIIVRYTILNQVHCWIYLNFAFPNVDLHDQFGKKTRQTRKNVGLFPGTGHQCNHREGR